MAEMAVSLLAILPLVVLIVWACVLLLINLFISQRHKGVIVLLSVLGLMGDLALVVLQARRPAVTAFGGMIVIDGFANRVCILLLVSGLASIALAYHYLKRKGWEQGEYYVLLLFAIAGMMLISMSADLIIVFLALELLSLPLYVLAGIAGAKASSQEAAIKYFLLGAFASSFFVYGTALIYGASGTTALKGVFTALSSGGFEQTFLLLGAGLIVVGLGFKIAVVPFHMWTPDVYQGAPSAVSAFMAVGAKVAGFAALLRVFILAMPSLAIHLTAVFWVIAALTMILGNLVAIVQRNIKRLLAYSSIAHAGYLLMALVPFGQTPLAPQLVSSGLFYLAAYALTNFAAWAVVIALEHEQDKGLELQDYAGLGRRHPAMAATMAVAMLSFTGIPPTLGFMGKFVLFRTAIEGGFIGLALVGVLTSLVSAYYYLRVVVIMYMQEGEPILHGESWLYFTAYGTALGTLVLGIFSAPLIRWASQALMQLF